jgi:hypothetical protein
MSIPSSRRRILQLSTGCLVSLTGCFDISDVPDVQLFNNMAREISVTTAIERVDDGTTVFSDTTTIARGDAHRYGNPIREEATFRIIISVESGPEGAYEWRTPADESYGLTIHLSRDGVTFGTIVS